MNKDMKQKHLDEIERLKQRSKEKNVLIDKNLINSIESDIENEKKELENQRNKPENNYEPCEFFVFLIADGYEKITPDFLKKATNNGFFDES